MTTGIEVHLRDGSRARIRPIRPQDRALLEDGFARLSPESRYLRFHTMVTALTDAQLRYLTEVDHIDHVAFIALSAGGDDTHPPGQGLGVARYVRLAEEPEIAEAAVTVVDDAQGRGLGTLLLGTLARHALANGVRVFRNYVLPENRSMLRLFDDLGAERTIEDGGVYRVDFVLPENVEDLPDTPAGRVFRAAACHQLPALDVALPPVWLSGGLRPAATPPTRSGRERGAFRDWLDLTFGKQGSGDDKERTPSP